MLRKTIRGITFDAGGTLLHPYPSVGAIYAEVMAEHELKLDPGVLDLAFRRAWKNAHRTPRIGITEEGEKKWWRDVVHETLRGLEEPSDFEALFESLWTSFAEPRRWRLYEDAREVLFSLKAGGYRLGLLSNWDKRLRRVLEGMEILSCFDAVIISSEVGFEKPDARIFQMAQERMGLKPEELLHVGDSVHHDGRGAAQAGWQSLLLSDQDPQETACLQIARLDEIPARLGLGRKNNA